MRNTKREFCSYLIFDYRGVEAHLSQMAARGWRLEKIGPWFWTYRRAEPAQVAYAVTYLPSVSQFSPEPSADRENLEELCAAAGWEPVAEWVQMQVFANERPDPVPLETAESVRLAAIHRSMKKGFLRWGAVMLVLALVMAGLQVKTLLTDPYSLLSSTNLFPSFVWELLLVLQAGNLLWYGRWLRRSRRSVAQGGACADVGPGLRRFNLVILWLVLAMAALFLVSTLLTTGAEIGLFVVCYTAGLVLLILLVDRTRRALKRRGAARGLNIFLTLLVDVVLAVVLVGGSTWLLFSSRGLFNGETYHYQGQTWDAAPVSLPLTVEDVTGQHYEHVRRYSYGSGSLLIRERSCRETVLDGEDLRILDYDITTLALPGLYDLALEHCQTERYSSWPYRWQETDPAPWGAEAAYQLFKDTGVFQDTYSLYILCWPDRIVQLNLSDLAPTPDQMAVIGEKLQNA